MRKHAPREFTNELGNRIKITIEGPSSISENILTEMEARHMRDALIDAIPLTPADAKAKELTELADVAGRSWKVGDAVSEDRAALFDKCSALILSQAETIAAERAEVARLWEAVSHLQNAKPTIQRMQQTPARDEALRWFDRADATLARAAKEGQDA